MYISISGIVFGRRGVGIYIRSGRRMILVIVLGEMCIIIVIGISTSIRREIIIIRGSVVVFVAIAVVGCRSSAVIIVVICVIVSIMF